ncbi:integrase core domain-containing protein, partial [Buchananella hordeovulneris]|uniref:integrase core domain-containing protein n=1 Tax=Buchananella hordeovulneris TaxID=52770 RepID=UPI001C9E2C12
NTAYAAFPSKTQTSKILLNQPPVHKPACTSLLADHKAFPDTATAYRSVFHWANRYNTRRRHSAIGNVPPNTYENTITTKLTTTT